MISAIETFGGQACLLFILYYSTLVSSALHIHDGDLTKQAFAAILGFLTGRSVAHSDVIKRAEQRYRRVKPEQT